MLAACLLGSAMLSACQRTESVQRGYRGTNMSQVYRPFQAAAAAQINFIPEPEASDPYDPEAPAISEVFQNVRVLNDLTVNEFSRLMQALATWVAPDQGCEFCHNPENLASDEKYTKVVARRMLQMTRDINTNWKQHVSTTGVTCWTCHRGQAVPSGDWFSAPHNDNNVNMIGDRAGQNRAGVYANGNTSLPSDPLSLFLTEDANVRVQGTRPLAGENRHSIKQAEHTYSLMIYMSQSLGVNCSYCHSTRALARWDESSPQRSTAWYGLRMVRNINSSYLIPLQPLFPAHRLSAEGDGPKVGCETCHKKTFKPLAGVSMLGDYPELGGPLSPSRFPAPAGGAASAAAASVLVDPAKNSATSPTLKKAQATQTDQKVATAAGR
jgi:photosynthetic reaction center cytochrome c subunit